MRPTIDISKLGTNDADGVLTCPKCGCKEFGTYSTNPAGRAVQRYKKCRNPSCGQKILTTSITTERVIREIGPSKERLAAGK